MKDGFLPVAAVTPEVRVADVDFNVDSIQAVVTRAVDAGAKLVVCPELCVTGYTCEDLFNQDALLRAAEEGVARIAHDLRNLDAVVLVGAPLRVAGRLYDCAFVLTAGRLLGVVPKSVIPTYGAFYEGRHFTAGPAEPVPVDAAGFLDVPFGANQLFQCEDMPGLVLGVEVGVDLWSPQPPSTAHALAGATVIANLAATVETVGAADTRRRLVVDQSARLECAYVYAEAGWGESTTDAVFAGHDLVAERGTVLAESLPFGDGLAASEVDLGVIAAERQRITAFPVAATPEVARHALEFFRLDVADVELTRPVDPFPFVPDTAEERTLRCETIFSIQAAALARRLQHTGSKAALVGISGGLDSTLALLVTVRAFDLLGLPRTGIVAITMPGFGTTERTHGNAEQLALSLGCELREVSITASVRQHFADIGHDESVRNATYENAQARERTQILMDVANEVGGLVVGTGDLSELALGWATYNGDHMSMYGVNASIPKTLIRYVVRYVADTCGDETIERVLLDVLDTPVSPELLPAEDDGSIAQKTEDLVGPYELHDFFLFQVLRHGFAPAKVFRLACVAFDGEHGAPAYEPAVVLHWLKTFYRRFFSQQFKRSCSPDGPKVGSVGVSPRGDLRMPSDASRNVWLAELEALEA